MRSTLWSGMAAAWLTFTLLPMTASSRDADLRAAMSRLVTAATDAKAIARVRTLWPAALDAPLVLHDPAGGASLRWSPREGDIHPVTLPAGQSIANSCFVLDGTPTAMLLAPLPEPEAEMAALAWHERWHCAQAALGLPAKERDNAHLDTETGRTWLRLELRALRETITSADDAQARAHARAALAFRAARGRDGGQALAREAALERNEGLAEYTGRFVAEPEVPMRARLAADLRRADAADNFVRSFAYFTGPAYGTLLDRWAQGWRVRISDDSTLPGILGHALAAGPEPTATEIERLARAYGVEEVREQERKRIVARQGQAERIRASLRHALSVALRQPQVSFDPHSLFPLGDEGTFYSAITVRDTWGELRAREGALLAPDWGELRVAAERAEGCGDAWSAPEWQLRLKPGWRVVERGAGLFVEPGEPAPCEASGEAMPTRSGQ